MNEIDAKKIAIGLMDEHGLLTDGWLFKFNNAKRSLGKCSTKKVISLSKHAISKITVNEVKNTILHEIAHALVGVKHGHDNVWKRKAIEIGCNGNRTYDKPLKIEGKYKAVCNGCNVVVYKHRKPKRSGSCSNCSGGRYNPEYKFEYIQQY